MLKSNKSDSLEAFKSAFILWSVKIFLLIDYTDGGQAFMAATEAVDEKINSTVENNALQMLKKLNGTNTFPGLIFLHYHMPHIEAGEFLELLRSIEGLSKVPIVLQHTGPDAFFTNPFRLGLGGLSRIIPCIQISPHLLL